MQTHTRMAYTNQCLSIKQPLLEAERTSLYSRWNRSNANIKLTVAFLMHILTSLLACWDYS